MSTEKPPLGRVEDLVEVLHFRQDLWNSQHVSTGELCKSYNSLTGIVVVFLDTPELTSSSSFDIFCNKFGIPSSFWTDVLQEASGFFGTQDAWTEDDELDNYSTFLRLLIKETDEAAPPNEKGESHVPYRWLKLGFFTQWKHMKSNVLLCFDVPDDLKAKIRTWRNIVSLANPFAIHAALLEAVIPLYDSRLWKGRKLVRDYEKNRTKPQDPSPHHVTMHEIARHTIHFVEMLGGAISIVENVLQEHDLFLKEHTEFATSPREAMRVTKSIRHQKTLLECFHLRSMALEKRLNNEINLAFYLVARHDSLITQTDSATMKTISILGLVFLPGTFVSAIFSMTFFFNNNSSTEWGVSNKFWIYWVITVPVTLATLFVWKYWQAEALPDAPSSNKAAGGSSVRRSRTHSFRLKHAPTDYVV